MSLREPVKEGIKSKYVKSPNGRIFLNNPNLAKLSDMSAVDVQGFEDPAPETVGQLNEMIANGLKKPAKPDENAAPADDATAPNNALFDFSKATKKQIAKKAKENFNAELVIDDKDVSELRTEYEFLLVTSGNNNDDTSSGSD